MQDTFESLGLEYRKSRRHPGVWLWPRDDVWAWKWLNKIGHWDLPVQISELCENKNLVIQAGGNAGLYPKQYSRLFQSVITMEPDHKNFTLDFLKLSSEMSSTDRVFLPTKNR